MGGIMERFFSQKAQCLPKDVKGEHEVVLFMEWKLQQALLLFSQAFYPQVWPWILTYTYNVTTVVPFLP